MTLWKPPTRIEINTCNLQPSSDANPTHGAGPSRYLYIVNAFSITKMHALDLFQLDPHALIILGGDQPIAGLQSGRVHRPQTNDQSAD